MEKGILMRVHRWDIWGLLLAAIGLCACSASAPARISSSSRSPASEALFPAGHLQKLPIIDWEKVGARSLDRQELAFWRRVVGDRDVDFQSYSNLFPSRFRIVPGEDAQSLVDRITQKIFATPTGRRGLCFLSTGDAKAVRDYLGVSSAAARAIRQACAHEIVSDAQKKIFRAMRSQVLNLPAAKRSKRILFVFPEGPPAAVEGFTTKENTTLYLVMENELSEMKLVRMFAYELVMSYDQFS